MKKFIKPFVLIIFVFVQLVSSIGAYATENVSEQPQEAIVDEYFFEIVSYDPINKIEKTEKHELSEILHLVSLNSTDVTFETPASYNSDDNSSEQPMKIIDDDNRQIVTNTTDFPYRCIGKLIMWWDRNGDGRKNITTNESTNEVYEGTGFMQGPDVVVTAGHNIYVKNYGGWPTEVIYVPAKNSNSDPYGQAKAIQYFTNGYWMSDENGNNDWAVLTLDRDMQRYTGILGKALSYSSLANKSVTVTGYPDTSSMFTHTNIITSHISNNSFPASETIQLSHNCDATGGQSGSPIYDYRGIVYGIHVGGHVTKNYNIGIRFGPWLYNFLDERLAAGREKYGY